MRSLANESSHREDYLEGLIGQARLHHDANGLVPLYLTTALLSEGILINEILEAEDGYED